MTSIRMAIVGHEVWRGTFSGFPWFEEVSGAVGH